MLSWLHGPPLAIGTPAPDFTLPDQDEFQVTLSTLRGHNVVLIFYPRDETPICRQQLCEFRDEAVLMSMKDTLVLGINPGDSNSHLGFHTKLKLPFPLLVDSGGEVAKKYRSKGVFMTVRTVYLIDRAGQIRFAQRGKPAVAEVLSSAE